MSKSKIIHLITPFLFHTGSWIYSQLMGLQNFSNFVFTQHRENSEQFPYDSIYSFDELNFFEKYITKIHRKLNGDHYGLFFNKYLEQIKPNLFHAHMGYEAVRWLRFIKKSKLPLITTFYGLDVSKLARIPYWREKYIELFEYGSFFLAEGTFLKKQIQLLGCPEEKVLIQHLGINLENYPLKDFVNQNDGNDITLLQVSTFREKKGIEYTLKTMKILKSKYPRIKLNLIGKGDDDISNNKVFQSILELDLINNVNLLGIKSHHDTIQEMLRADIFIHPSVTSRDGDSEGGAPVGIMEASAVGLPVISTYHADIPEVIINEISGMLSEERDSEGLARNLDHLIKLPEKRRQFGLAGREHIKKNYNLIDQIKNLENIYTLVING